jgi:hypothetical protein
MNIFLIFPQADGQTGVAIKDGFKQNGCDIVTIEPSNMDEISNVMESHNGDFDLILCSRTPQLAPEIQKIKLGNPDIPIAIWNTDVRDNVETWGNEFLQFVVSADYYFCVTPDVERWERYQPNTHFLAQGIQDSIYHKSDIEEKKYDVGFIGGCNPAYHHERVGVLATLLSSNIDFHWYTDVWGEEHNRAVGECRIQISASGYPEYGGWSVRIWKIIAGGGIVLELDRDGFKDYFNGNVETYKNHRDCVTKCNNILEDIDEWEHRADEVHEWAMDNHTYFHRVKELLEIVI